MYCIVVGEDVPPPISSPPPLPLERDKFSHFPARFQARFLFMQFYLMDLLRLKENSTFEYIHTPTHPPCIIHQTGFIDDRLP